LLLYFRKYCKISIGGDIMEGGIGLNKEEIIKIIEGFNTNKENLEINVVFMNSNFTRKEKYKE